MLFFFIIFMIAVIFFAIYILKSVQEVEDLVTDPLNSKSNVSDEEFGENLKGSTIEEKREKIKDPSIAPPELGG